MNTPMIIAFGVLITIMSVLIFFLKRFSSSDAADEEEIEEAVRAKLNRASTQRPNRGLGTSQPSERPRGARHRIQRHRPTTAEQQQNSDDSNDDLDDPLAGVDLPEGKIGAKKLRKLQEKAEKKAAREAELREREEKKKRDAKLERQRIANEEKERELEKELEEERKKKQEEDEKREHEEYLKLKENFSIEEEGEDVQVEISSDSLLQEFIDHIKTEKVVIIEDLAAHFKLKTQDTIDRVRDLVSEGKLTGVMDDRGKFIYITQSEYEAVAKFVRQRGRVSITELAECSNRLINLNPEIKPTKSTNLSQVPVLTESC